MIDFSNIFYEVALILAIATGVAFLALRLRQPLIIAFIIVGILIGPAGINVVNAGESLELFAELGIALLLFVVGLKLDPHEIQAVGPVALTTGIGQILITGSLGYLIAIALGLNSISAFYIGISLTFSSTIIIVKLLSDRREIDALHGRIALGILIVQDIVVVLVMIALSAFTESTNQGLGKEVAIVLLKGSLFLACVALITRYIFPKLLPALAQSTELLLIFAISWAVALAAVGDGLGFSQEVGAFLAGVSLAATPYRTDLGARLVSLRDFLLLFFFIDLGVHIDVAHLGDKILPALILSAFVLIGKPLMVMALVGLMGYHKYTSVITSLSLGQISEFSLILATLGVSLGQINEEILGLITLIGIITMAVSTYMIIDSHRLYDFLSPYLSWINRLNSTFKKQQDELTLFSHTQVDIIVFGLGRYGGNLLQYLSQQPFSIVGIDFDPELVQSWRKQGILAFYGDAEDPEFAATLPLNTAKWVVSTLPGERVGLALLRTLKQLQFQGKIALTSHSVQEKQILKQEGADLVLLPFNDAAKEAAQTLVELTACQTEASGYTKNQN
ncbi:MAG: cation:proton antiporter family protein [Microcoleaceae cyanobacterium]